MSMYEKIEDVLLDELPPSGYSFSSGVIAGVRSNIHRHKRFVIVHQCPTQEVRSQSIWIVYFSKKTIMTKLIFESDNPNTRLELDDARQNGSKIIITYIVTITEGKFRSFARTKKINT